MLDLYELKQLVAFADLGTLSKVAEAFHISTPSITRSMQHLEESFGVPLFIRGKNRIELNATGEAAVEYGRKLLQETEQTVAQVRAFDLRQRTIVIKSCAPAPLWELMKKLNAAYPDRTISSAICQNEEVMAGWKNAVCDIAVFPAPVEGAQPFMREHLYVCVPENHELAQYESLTFEQINGFNFLLRTELGFWDTMCRQKMPASKFLVQSEEDVFRELVKSSSLPCFTTDYVNQGRSPYTGRVNVPVTDEEANVTFYLAIGKTTKINLDSAVLQSGINVVSFG